MTAIIIVVGLIACMAAGTAAPQSSRVGARWVSRSIRPVLALACAGISVGFVWAVGSVDKGGSASIYEYLVGVLLVCCLALGAFLFGVNLAGFDPDADVIARRLAIDHTSQRLLSRWTHRVRWRRWIGGVAGIVMSLFSGNPGWVLFAGITGAALGSISAELHLCRPEPSSQRVVSLEHRQVRDYIDRRSIVGLAGVLVAAVAAGAWLILDEGRSAETPWIGAALVAVAVATALIWQVVRRRRPALSPELHAADDLLRGLAVSNGIAQPMMSVGLVLIATGLSRAGAGNAAFVVGLGAVVVWWRNRRGGLDYVLKHPVKAAHLLARPHPS